MNYKNYKATLQAILQRPPNYNRCSDCHNLNPTWCSTTFIVFLCTRCATFHKQILNRGPYASYIKSISLDHWDTTDLNNFEQQICPWDIDRSMFSSSDNSYDLEQLLKNKYIIPVQQQSRSNNVRSHSNNSPGSHREWPILTGRRARDQELRKFAHHIREIQSRSTNFYTTDNICEALSITRGNEFEALQILRYNFQRNQPEEEAKPPSLPARPDQSLKNAVFDGFNTINNPTSFSNNSNNNTNGPKPAIFDGMNDMTANNNMNIQFGQQQQQQQQQINPFQMQPPLQQNYTAMPQIPQQQATQNQLQPQLTQPVTQLDNSNANFIQQPQLINPATQFGMTNVQQPMQQPGLPPNSQLNMGPIYSQHQPQLINSQIPPTQQVIAGQPQFIPQNNNPQFLGQTQLANMQPQYTNQWPYPNQ